MIEATRRLRSPALRWIAVVGLVAAIAGAPAAAFAALLSLSEASFEFQIGSYPELPAIDGPGTASPIGVSSGTGDFVLPAGVVSGSLPLPNDLFTGVPVISGLSISASNPTGTLAAGAGPGGGFGGGLPMNGEMIFQVLGGLFNGTVPLTVVGSTRTFQTRIFTVAAAFTGHAWTTGPVAISGITTQTPGGAFVNTVTLSGSDARTAGHRGTLQLVSPVRILTNFTGNLPAYGLLRLEFVPEPGTAVLLGLAAAVAGVAIRGRSPRDSRPG